MSIDDIYGRVPLEERICDGNICSPKLSSRSARPLERGASGDWLGKWRNSGTRSLRGDV